VHMFAGLAVVTAGGPIAAHQRTAPGSGWANWSPPSVCRLGSSARPTLAAAIAVKGQGAAAVATTRRGSRGRVLRKRTVASTNPTAPRASRFNERIPCCCTAAGNDNGRDDIAGVP
jgi:hypothetical protein